MELWTSLDYCTQQPRVRLPDWVITKNLVLLRYISYVFSLLPPKFSSTIMRAFNFSPSTLLFFLIFRPSLAASIIIPEGGDDSLIFSNSEDGSSYFDGLSFDSTFLSQGDRCADATKSPRKRQSKPSWCQTQDRAQYNQQPAASKGQQQDRSGWTDKKFHQGDLPSQLQFLENEPRLLAEPKPNKEICKGRGIFAVCAADRDVGWWGPPDSMQFKLDPCTPCLLLIHSKPGFKINQVQIVRASHV